MKSCCCSHSGTSRTLGWPLVSTEFRKLSLPVNAPFPRLYISIRNHPSGRPARTSSPAPARQRSVGRADGCPTGAARASDDSNRNWRVKACAVDGCGHCEFTTEAEWIPTVVIGVSGDEQREGLVQPYDNQNYNSRGTTGLERSSDIIPTA